MTEIQGQKERRVIDILMPTTPTRYTLFMGWATLVANLILIGTGGLVRLTESGLGCPTWPKCTADSFTTTPEMGIHGIIEFGNRTLSGLISVVALLTFLSIVRAWKRGYKTEGILALILGLLIFPQAIIGGLSVLAQLQPFLVGLHFLFSALMVAVATIYVWRLLHPLEERARITPLSLTILTHVTSLFCAVSLFIGVLTAGSGPYAGDHGAARNGLDPQVMQHVHSYPAYVFAILSVAVVVLASRLRLDRLAKWASILIGLIVVQIAVGIFQSNFGLPIWAVNLHMVISGLIICAMVCTVMALKGPRQEAAEARPEVAVPTSSEELVE